MKTLVIPRFILYSIVLLIINICIFSCVDQEKENNDFSLRTSSDIKSKIDFNLIDSLNESNKKTIELSSTLFSRSKDVKTLQFLLKIKKDHQKIDSQLKNLTQKNLIVIPKLVYNLNLNADSLKEKNVNSYLSNLLKVEIENQISLLNQIEKNTQNIDFKTFAIQSKKSVQANNDSLKTL